MLHINDLTYQIGGRTLFSSASAAIPEGHKVGLVGRNGTGKTTLLKLLSGEIEPDEGIVRMPNGARMGVMPQEAPGGSESLLETVLAADTERSALLTEADLATDPHRIGEIHTRLADIDAHSAPARAAAILYGLGFDAPVQQRACREFSGGWRMRVALAALLFSRPDVLLLDEPSNYLDLEGVLWLETYIRTYPGTVLIVSHDRDLLNNSVSSIMHLANRNLTVYKGGYDRFEDTRREKQRLQLKLKKKQDDQRRHMQAFVDRFRAQANKAKQAQSRLKALEKLQPVVAQVDDAVMPFHFPDPEKKLANPLMRLEEASAGYGEETILKDLSLRIDIEDRIGLLGANGNGKSTFAKLLSARIAPMRGHRRCSKKIQIGFFAQHQLDELKENQSPYDHIAPLMEDATEAQKRARVQQAGFSTEKMDTKCAHLSGGEKARLLFALATFHGPHLLILDEPTNHLDVDSREVLIHAINAYEGAVILISHDRHLISACVDRLWIVKDGTVGRYEGDIETYRQECLAERSGRRAKSLQDDTQNDQGMDTPSGNTVNLDRKEKRRLEAARRKSLAPLRKKVKKIEKEMDALTTKIAKLDTVLGKASLYENEPDKATQFAQMRGELAKELEAKEEQWMLAGEELETAELTHQEEPPV